MFAQLFGVSVASFYAGFNAFLRLPLRAQYAILPAGRVLRDTFTPDAALCTASRATTTAPSLGVSEPLPGRSTRLSSARSIEADRSST